MMIGVEKARELLIENSKPISNFLLIFVQEACGYVLAEDIHSPCDMPHFKQSSVDGYGIKLSGGQIKKEYKVISVVKAGEAAKDKPGEDECIRIFTGAMVVDDVDFIIMQEDVERTDEKIIIKRELKPITNHIRLRGSQIKKGELSMEAGQLIKPAGIGLLQAMGITNIKVFRKPKVSILTGGDELIMAGEKYLEGKVYESNAYALKAAIENEGAEVQEIKTAKDSKEELAKKFSALLEVSDVVLVSGGISVGDYDYVSQVFEEAGIQQIFHRVLQKPGKPIYFGKLNNKLVFGLPGNPASTLCCFYEYVLPALRKMMHKKAYFLACLQLPLSASITKNKNLGVFFKAMVNDSYTMVKPLEGQESYMLNSFAVANALIYVSSGKEQISAGEIVEVHLLPE